MAYRIFSFFLKITLALFLFIGLSPAISAPYNKGWVVSAVTGSLSDDSSFRYYLEPQLRLIDDTYFFNQLLLLGGLGYQFNNDMSLFIGPGWIVTKTPENATTHEERYWEQFNWRVVNKPYLNLISRTRFEQRKNVDESRIALRLRPRMWLRIPFKNNSKYSFSIFDELFFNLNHPQWVSPRLFEQNRAFIGIAAQLSNSILMDVGYLNQHLRSFTNQTDNVLLLSFTITI
ncbi:hypothetical protein TUM19329_25890 [Legionella antarctica]|uniref:DUF2490 domain-containing protein n=1 Tax=Legionella antarctica TaxID=2708020 RepID=A0A6F8T740_9GAMM|nr:DUF2490 domain-containing protein [Legionella antarctica]BCA96228.1 hypothetical protein TUM19329_25890 [Legionella antarctica]